MNKAKLKSYAPQARKDFIAAVTARANLLGLSEKAGKLETAPSQPQGDVTVIAGQAWPVKVHGQREQLISRIRKDGFAQTMEAVAYTWFNRFAALRYMELHDYLGHGYRALSSQDGALPDILTHAADLAHGGELPGLKAAVVAEMKLAGNRDSELYRMLLVAQCNALSNVMPFLFERIDDETELLLPDNLLRTDSVIAKLVDSIAEEDWKEVEIIGWLYQFYISEKKNEVIGKLVKTEDIPAATQLFTPNWIVKYLVQNSIGRLWLMANPASTLKSQWPYYIESADQPPEVRAQLDALIKTRIDEDGGSLNPESLTLLDPACGSGHILAEAYEVLKAIYLERGYQFRSIPRLILEKNLYGLDIDDRAAQMASFALLMKARADDRRLFNQPVKLHVLSLHESKGMDAKATTFALQAFLDLDSPQIAVNASTNRLVADSRFSVNRRQIGLGQPIAADTMTDPTQRGIAALIAIFAEAKTFGSLIQIPQDLNAQLASLTERVKIGLESGDLYVKATAQDLWPLIEQANVLGMQFDAVVANPPYMGGKGMNAALKNYAKTTFSDTKFDLFAMFMERGFSWCKQSGFNSMVTMQSWMFLSSYETMREKLLGARTIHSMAHLGARAFSEISGEVVQTTAFILQAQYFRGFKPVFFRLVDGLEHEKKVALLNRNHRFDTTAQDEFKKIPGSPIVYWFSKKFYGLFSKNKDLSEFSEIRAGLQTGDNDTFLRYWHEVSINKVGLKINSRQDSVASNKKWFPHNKGGGFRKWYGNSEYLIDWHNDGQAIKAKKIKDLESGKITPNNSKCWNQDYYFLEGLTWSSLTSGAPSIRANGPGYLFDTKGQTLFPKAKENVSLIHGFLNSKVASVLLTALSPTLDFNGGVFAKLPIIELPDDSKNRVNELVASSIEISRNDWNKTEQSWDFSMPPVLSVIPKISLPIDYGSYCKSTVQIIAAAQKNEQEINSLFIDAYGLQGELSSEVSDSEIALTRSDREKDCQRLISYAVGCMMGRYSLDKTGLIYADASNVHFDAGRYIKFPADTDGIVPLTDELWFEDDAASRTRDFLIAVWGANTISENITWLAESLGNRPSENPDDAIRRYLADKFYKDHLQTYKKRPIYWLFSSGKQGSFQALVYIHRYHEGTLARMRAEYVVPLTGKIQSRIDMLQKDAAAAVSTAARNKLTKEVEKLKKKHVELLAYDEQLRHYADMRITLDLDDGVKVNYGKFGDLLAEVKTVTGGTSDD